MTAPRVLVTRPAREAAHWVDALNRRGCTAAALPLIAIKPCTHAADRQALQQAQARARQGHYRALMFVSGNAVAGFFEQNSASSHNPIDFLAINTRAWAPGPGTASALADCGVPAQCIAHPAVDAAQFDSEALWAEVAPQVQPGDRVLVVRGRSAGAHQHATGTGRDWLARQIEARGGQVDWVVAYERGAPQLDADQTALADAALAHGSWWLLSSSEAVEHLATALPGRDWGPARALATHPRIADAARAAGFGTVRECRPALDDVVASIESTA